MKKPSLIEVTWTDASNDFGPARTLSAAKLVKLSTRHTAGYLVDQNDERTILAETYDPPDPDEDEGRVDNLTVIPTPWIRKLRYLGRQPRKEKPSGTTT